MTGIIVDRGVGQDVPAGPWEAVVYQATHDSTGLDVGFERNWKALVGKRRGAYHFARPGGSSAAQQARLFVERVRNLGWNPKTDIWMLDVEVKGLKGVALYRWIQEFMEFTKGFLGDRGFLYIGWPFYVVNVSAQDYSLLNHYRWWLPDYSINDGLQHPIGRGEPFLPVLHQYTSNPFDKSVVINQAAWAALWTPGVVVHQDFDPPLTVISHTLFTHNTYGVCHAELGPDGGVYATPGVAYLGSPNGKAYFKGRKAKRIAARAGGGYSVFAESGEQYNYPEG